MFSIVIFQLQLHTQEIQRLKSETADLSHRVSYLHKALQERESKLEMQETDLVWYENDAHSLWVIT